MWHIKYSQLFNGWEYHKIMFDCLKQVVVVALLCFGGSLATKYFCLSNETRIDSSNLIVLYSINLTKF